MPKLYRILVPVTDPFGNPICFVDRDTIFTGNR
jgi:hypothetical protein